MRIITRLGIVILVLVLEQMSRGRARFHNTSRQHRPHPGRKLSPLAGALAAFACFMPLLFGFLIPSGLLLHMAITEGDAHFGPRFFDLARNSFILALVTATIAVACALLLAYARRLSRRILPRIARATKIIKLARDYGIEVSEFDDQAVHVPAPSDTYHF